MANFLICVTTLASIHLSVEGSTLFNLKGDVGGPEIDSSSFGSPGKMIWNGQPNINRPKPGITTFGTRKTKLGDTNLGATGGKKFGGSVGTSISSSKWLQNRLNKPALGRRPPSIGNWWGPPTVTKVPRRFGSSSTNNIPKPMPISFGKPKDTAKPFGFGTTKDISKPFDWGTTKGIPSPFGYGATKDRASIKNGWGKTKEIKIKGPFSKVKGKCIPAASNNYCEDYMPPPPNSPSAPSMATGMSFGTQLMDIPNLKSGFGTFGIPNNPKYV